MKDLKDLFEGERERDESGKFVAKEKPVEAKAEPETPKTDEIATEVKPAEAKGEVTATPAEKTVVQAEHEEPAELRGMKAAHMAEKQKRKDAERRVKEYEQKLQDLQRQPPPDPNREPEAYAAHYQNLLIDEKVNMSDEYAREKHEDYEEVMKDWDAAVKADPTLYQRSTAQKFPCEWAYQQLKRGKFLESIGDPENWTKQKEAEIEARIAAKYAKLEVPTPSLANANGSGRETTTAFSGPTPLNQIFRR